MILCADVFYLRPLFRMFMANLFESLCFFVFSLFQMFVLLLLSCFAFRGVSYVVVCFVERFRFSYVLLFVFCMGLSMLLFVCVLFFLNLVLHFLAHWC